MSATTNTANASDGTTPEQTHRCCHPYCIACSDKNKNGLGLRFTQEEDGSVTGYFGCDGKYQGYPDRLHGGIVSMLVDAAMVNCLFERKVEAVTAKLNLRFHQPVAVGVPATIRAWLERETPPIYGLRAEVRQRGELKASAESLFFQESSK